MSFTLPALPYAVDALEPSIDKMTMEIHHGRHHKAYVDNLNKALETAPDLAGKPINDLLKNLNGIPEGIRNAVRNNGGGHANHSFFWEIMGPGAGGAPTGDLAAAITSTFGSVDAFKAKIKEAALGRFGSGWAWLAASADGKLHVLSTANQDTPISDGHTPLLGVDVWEHAYYLKYQNKRADYVDAWWNVARWDKVAERFAAARSKK
jgi:superoxide dismutase, Fe-Mn family